MQIRQLEEELGVWPCSGGSVEAAKAGTLLHQRAREIVAPVERTQSEIAAVDRETSETIRLGTTPALMPLVGVDLAMHVREQVPQVILGLIEEMRHVLIERLMNAEIDYILCYNGLGMRTRFE